VYRLLIGCLFVCSLYGQNQHKLLWEADAFDLICLELPFANTVVVSTSLDNTIALEYQTEGEYKNHLVLRTFQVGKTLQVVEQKGPSFNAFNDKLSAQKVWVSTLKLFLPDHFNLQLEAQNARLDIQGNFNPLNLQLYEGDIMIKGQKITGEVKTNKADIHLFGESHKAHAISKYGIISGPFIPANQSELKLSSTEGNISFISQRK
jgi:hypothetical protein